MPHDGSTQQAARFPALDGLRGIAILLVLLVHSAPPTGPGPLGWVSAALRTGWVGVDLFLVLSGFLITRALLRARERPGRFRAFYARRARRTFPLYYATLAGLIWVAPAVGGSAAAAVAPLADAQAWFWTHLANVRLALVGPGGVPAFAAHFWSLSLEEQFYLLWPAVVFWTPRRRLPLVCAAAVVGALALRVALVAASARPAFAQLLMPARLDAFGAGALVAAVAPEVARRHAGRLLVGAGAAVLALAPTLLRAPGSWLGLTAGYTALALLAAAAVALGAFADEAHPLQRLGRTPGLRLLGRYSYGLYVLHLPLYVALAHGGWTAAAIAARLGTSLAAAYPIYLLGAVGCAMAAAAASWHLLESPILNGRRRRTAAQSLAPTPVR